MRLVVLMIEVEQPEGVSARKLVLETARHNVITAYSAAVGMKLLNRFPKVDVVVIHTEMDDYPFEQTVRDLRQIRHDVPVIGISPHDHLKKGMRVVARDHVVRSTVISTITRPKGSTAPKQQSTYQQ